MSNHEDEITRFLADWTTAEAKGDVAAMDAQLADDFTAVGPLGFTLHKVDWLDRHATGALVYETFQLEEVVLRDLGDAVVATARQTGEAASTAIRWPASSGPRWS